jgi:hypothetical protein
MWPTLGEVQRRQALHRADEALGVGRDLQCEVIGTTLDPA